MLHNTEATFTRLNISSSQNNYNTASHKGLQTYHSMPATNDPLDLSNNGPASEPLPSPTRGLSKEPVLGSAEIKPLSTRTPPGVSWQVGQRRWRPDFQQFWSNDYSKRSWKVIQHLRRSSFSNACAVQEIPAIFTGSSIIYDSPGTLSDPQCYSPDTGPGRDPTTWLASSLKAALRAALLFFFFTFRFLYYRLPIERAFALFLMRHRSTIDWAATLNSFVALYPTNATTSQLQDVLEMLVQDPSKVERRKLDQLPPDWSKHLLRKGSRVYYQNGKGLTYHPTYAVMTNLPPKRLKSPNLPPNWLHFPLHTRLE